MRENNRVVFFGSGDFPVETFKLMIKSDDYKVVGLVTSKDRTVFGNKRLIDIAKENEIPFYVPTNLKSNDFLEWLDSMKADIFCVISYKFLPKEVLEKCHGLAFNVHASLLPYLRGAAPINWAIRLGFKETGLTIFRLCDKIDCGSIISSHKVSIDDNETYGSLFRKLADLCVLVTDAMITDYSNGKTVVPNVVQGMIPEEFSKLSVFHAPKLNTDNTRATLYDLEEHLNGTSTIEIDRMIRSLAPNIGTTFELHIYDKSKPIHSDDFIKPLPSLIKTVIFKVYESEIAKDKNDHSFDDDIITDWKNYFYISSSKTEDDVISVKKIQLPGKKILDIKEFLKGFQNFRNPSYEYKIN